MKSMKRTIAVLVAVSLMVGCVIGGTLSWLTSKTENVTNVFTTSDINVELKEHEYDPEKNELLLDKETTKGDNDFKMIPGWTIPKDPWVTVKANSEDCYVFLKVEEKGGNVTVDGVTHNFDSFIHYDIDPNNWTQLTDGDNDEVAGVYYCVAQDITNDRNIKVLGYTDNQGTFHNNQVYVKETVTKEMMNAVTEATKPTLTFTAYASQMYKNNTETFEVYEAWMNILANQPPQNT